MGGTGNGRQWFIIVGAHILIAFSIIIAVCVLLGLGDLSASEGAPLILAGIGLVSGLGLLATHTHNGGNGVSKAPPD
jgi:hypothetical protein